MDPPEPLPTKFEHDGTVTVHAGTYGTKQTLTAAVDDKIAWLDVVPRNERPMNVVLVSVQIVDSFGKPAGLAGSNAPPNVGSPPASEALRVYLHRVFGLQANVIFPEGSVTMWPKAVNLRIENVDGVPIRGGNWNLQIRNWYNAKNFSAGTLVLFYVRTLGGGWHGEVSGILLPRGILSSDATLRTAAHEIGHMLGLRHSFGADGRTNVITVPDDSNRRLMGYGGGEALIRPEWEILNPQ